MGGWLIHPHHLGAPRPLKRDICIRNGNLAQELPCAQGQGKICRSQLQDPGAGHSPEVGLVPADRDGRSHARTGNSSPASLCHAGMSFSPLPELVVPKYAGLAHHSIQAASETWPCTSTNPNTLRSPLPVRAQAWSAGGTTTATSTAAWGEPQQGRGHPPEPGMH